ncbi:MAG: hypothetical protein ACI86H_000665 [bacterium]|jgi:hypothetical protein
MKNILVIIGLIVVLIGAVKYIPPVEKMARENLPQPIVDLLKLKPESAKEELRKKMNKTIEDTANELQKKLKESLK